VGRNILLNLRNVGRAVLMLLEAIAYVPMALSRRSRQDVFYQMYVAGIKSLGVISVVAAFTGMILALQTGLELRRFGLQSNIGIAVTVTMLREMGPFMAGLIIAASVGSAIAAQVGTMVVSEEVSALEIMSINPVRFIVMPRLVALAVMMPLLTVYTNILGVVGGAVVGATQLEVTMQAYFDNARLYAENKDLYVGLLKAFVFGIIIATTACHQGFMATEGAVGVGQATRRTVIISFLTILVMGYMLTRVFYR
jgi:phospholipid/cholesterol/gamma-HCH transport system permease protein